MMKLNILKKSMCVMVALVATVTSFAATADDYTDIVYAKDIKAAVGGTVEVPIYLKNPSYDVKSFQFTMVLPDGVSFVSDGTSNKATLNDSFDSKTWTLGFKTKTGEPANTSLATLYCGVDATTAIEKDDVEVFTITLQIDEDAAIGVKEILLSGIVLTDSDNGEHKIMAVGESIVSSLYIQSYDEGYSVQIAPFEFNEDVDGLEFVVETQNDLTNVSFDVVFPEGIGANQLYTVSKSLGNTTATTSIDDDEAGNVYVSVVRKNTKTIKDGNTIAKLEIGYDSEVLSDGIYEIQIKNVKMKDASGNEYLVAPYAANIFIGDAMAPVIDGKITFSGDYSDEAMADRLIASIPTDDATITEVDLKGVTALPEGKTITVANPNALVLTSIDLSLTNTNNVVIAGECNNFLLTDGNSFNVSREFIANNASYSRDFVSGQYWATICLPYAVQSDAFAAYYSIDKIEENTIYLEKMDEVPAGTPVLVKKISGTGISPTSTCVNVSSATCEPVSGDVTMYGCFTRTTVTDPNGYYIKDNMFYQRSDEQDGKFNIGAFRAYFVVNGSFVRLLSIADIDGETTSIDSLINTTSTNSVGVYDLNGVTISEISTGINIVRMNDGKSYKVIIK